MIYFLARDTIRSCSGFPNGMTGMCSAATRPSPPYILVTNISKNHQNQLSHIRAARTKLRKHCRFHIRQPYGDGHHLTASTCSNRSNCRNRREKQHKERQKNLNKPGNIKSGNTRHGANTLQMYMHCALLNLCGICMRAISVFF